MQTCPHLDPEWISWLDDRRLFTLNGEGQLFLWEVDESALKLVARTKTGETEKVRYHKLGAFQRDPGETIAVTSRVYELQLLHNGAVVWRRESTHSAPMHLRLEQGELTRAAVDRVLKPNGENFRGRLPSYVVRPEYREPLGTSKLSLGP